ncbi:MAG: Holliday junction resolvase RuvX [Crocinitomicaceae bacterium]|nr:Holliday junction resolvase RuvX [Crocinitomicaceae bacterium]
MSKILAIDYGAKRSGIAITDAMQIIASPLETIDTGRLVEWLSVIIDREKISELVVGEARYADGSASAITVEQENFVKTLKKKFPTLLIARQDERNTSKMAAEALVKGGMKKSSRQIKGNVDKVSAALILRAYLETK